MRNNFDLRITILDLRFKNLDKKRPENFFQGAFVKIKNGFK